MVKILSGSLIGLSIMAALGGLFGVVAHTVFNATEVCNYCFGTAVSCMGLAFLVAMFGLYREGHFS